MDKLKETSIIAEQIKKRIRTHLSSKQRLKYLEKYRIFIELFNESLYVKWHEKFLTIYIKKL